MGPAQFRLRLGDLPRTVVTTTPAQRSWCEASPTVTTCTSRGAPRSTTPPTCLPPRSPELRNRYEGTRLGRQELYGEILDDVPGALWTLATIDAGRAPTAPWCTAWRVVTAIDPVVTSGDDSDLTGVVTAGATDHGWCPTWARSSTASTTGSCSPTTRCGPPRRVVPHRGRRLRPVGGDRIVSEVNNGGDLIETVLRTVDHGVPYRKVTATRGKRVRAEPIAALYEQGRVHHVGPHRPRGPAVQLDT